MKHKYPIDPALEELAKKHVGDDNSNRWFISVGYNTIFNEYMDETETLIEGQPTAQGVFRMYFDRCTAEEIYESIEMNENGKAGYLHLPTSKMLEGPEGVIEQRSYNITFKNEMVST